MKIRTLGVDIGIASIGWAVIEGEYGEQGFVNKEIVESGVRIFTKAENPKTKESLALPRRTARSARRRNARRRARISQIKNYLSKALGLDLKCFEQEGNLAPLFQTSKDFLSPWELRERALYRVLNKEELARVILHIAKRRGYDDIIYGVEEKDKGVIQKAIQENIALAKEKDFSTLGEMMYKLYYANSLNVRNKKESYNRCVGRSELRGELEEIFKRQKEFGNPFITEEFSRKLLGDPEAEDKRWEMGLIFYQRPLKGFEDKIGDCQHIKRANENPKRACKQAPSAEEFIALTKTINFLKSLENQHGILVSSFQESVEQILKEAQKTKAGLSYAKLKSLLALPDSYQFRDLDYSDKNPEKKCFVSLPSAYIFNSILPELPRDKQDKIADRIGANKDWGTLEKVFKSLDLNQEQIQAIKEAKLNFSKHINLSLEALYHILPLMREGKRYDEAKEILEKKGIFAKPQHAIQDSLPPIKELAKNDSYFDIPNPVLNRALSEFRKVVNALLQKHGKVHYFNIELARDVVKSKKQRGEIERNIKNAEKENEEAFKKLEELGLSNTYKNRLKCKLWLQQNEYCIYSGAKIGLEMLKDEKALQIDHAIPLSRSLDDSQSNQVLCLSSSNQDKGNKTPYEWFRSDEKKWQDFVARVYASKFSASKKRKLTQKTFKERSAEEFLARNLVDTGYIGRVVKEYVKTSLSFLPLPNDKKDPIRIISGSLTSAMRNYWGIREKSREHHLHHAQDAIIIACIQPSVIQAYAGFIKDKENHFQTSKEKTQALREADFKTKFALRWPFADFKDKVQESIEKITVSHRVSCKVTGALHEETLRTKEDYYKSYGGEEGVERALKLGKIRQIDRGIVDNGEMVRVDIFKSKDKGKFYAVPIYTFDFALGKLPNKAIVSGKSDGIIKDWIEMDEGYEFCFSLFKNDCIRIQSKEMQEPVLAIYKTTSSSTASINFEHLSKYIFSTSDEEKFFTDVDKQGTKTFTKTNCGIQNLKLFQKVKLSPLGEVKECKPSQRQAIRLKSSPKNV